MSDDSGIIRAALEISHERRATLAQMRAAFERGDDAEALRHAQKLCGLNDAQKPNKKGSTK